MLEPNRELKGRIPPEGIEYIGGFREPPSGAKLVETVADGVGIFKETWKDSQGETREKLGLFPTGRNDQEKMGGAAKISQIETNLAAIREKPEALSLILERFSGDGFADLKEVLRGRNIDLITVLSRMIQNIEFAARSYKAKKEPLSPDKIEELIDRQLAEIKKQYSV